MSWRSEARIAMERDPCIRTEKEAMLFAQGVHAVLLYRLSHRHWSRGNFGRARMINYVSHVLTGADIHPAAMIGEGFFIDHATGLVIGETSIIGENVCVFQGVTLGGVTACRGKRHPTIGNNVTVGANATILGDIHIGDNVKVGAGSVVVKDVPSNSTIIGVPGRVVRREGVHVKVDLRHDDIPDPVNESISELQRTVDELRAKLADLESEIKKK